MSTTPSKVPLLDLAPCHTALSEEIRAAVGAVLDSQWFVLGEQGRQLESEVAALTGAKHGIGCASGSDALLLALMAFDVDRDQTVVTTPQSFFATVGAARRLGARVDFVDVEEGTINLDPAALRRFLGGCNPDPEGNLREPTEGKRVTTVISVDLFGRPCNYTELEAVCDEFGLHLIDDACQAIGAGVGDRRCGGFGKVAAFSFYPTKNLGGAGDGGMLTTDDDELADRLRRLRVHGQSTGRYHHGEVGFNSRLDELQAAVLRVKLPHLETWNKQRVEHAKAYDAAFAEIDGIRPLDAPADGVTAVYHLYVTRAQRRDELRAHLTAAGIGSGVYYPLPLHLQECFTDLQYRRGELPVAEAFSEEALALPMYPELGEDARDRVIAEIRSFYSG
jgi:dTDP-4-amino-4,6-dideoxygalactose transaminase